MTRNLSAAILNEIAARTCKIVQTVSVRFTSGWVQFTTAARNITFDGDIYTAGGSLLSISQIDEVLALKANSIDVSLYFISSYISLEVDIDYDATGTSSK